MSPLLHGCFLGGPMLSLCVSTYVKVSGALSICDELADSIALMEGARI